MKKTFAFSIVMLIPVMAAGFPQPEERFSKAMASITSILDDLEKDRREARDQRDAIRYVCVEDKVRGVSTALALVTARQESLNTAVSTGDKESADHEATIAEEILRKVEAMAAEAKLCSGSNLTRVDKDQQVKVTIDDAIIPEPMELPPSNLITEPPACASCFK